MQKLQHWLHTLVLLIPMIAESQNQNYLDFVSRDCYPSSPCTLALGCPQSTENAFVGLEQQSSCNQSSSSDDMSQFCLCHLFTCYKFREHCLHGCEDQKSDELEYCISCLRSRDQSLMSNGLQNIDTCKEYCKGMCLDRFCHETKDEDCFACVPGYWGRFCVDQCAPGCPGACHADSGFCVDCTTGNYGPSCELKCPENCLRSTCFSTNGTCESCVVGYQGQYCNETCPPGFYGNRCAFKCSGNCKGNRCDNAKGHCVDGCKPGYFGVFCEQQCPHWTFGEECLSNCPASCAEGRPCHHETGECQSGCLSGFMGAYCNQTCPLHKYGTNCYFNCSSLCFQELCNAFSGSCIGCDEGFYGSFCQFELNLDEIKQNTLEAEVSALQAVLMIAGIALLGVLMWIGVAYLLLQQRKKILRDAAKGINPEHSQWVMVPGSRGYRRAVNLYNKKWAHLGGGDAEAPYKEKEKEENKEKKREKMLLRARKKLKSWTFAKKKLKPPNEIELYQVSKWLAQNHGIKPRIGDVERSYASDMDKALSEMETTESSSETERSESEYGNNIDSDTPILNPGSSETAAAGQTTQTYTIEGATENAEMPCSISKGQDGTSLVTFFPNPTTENQEAGQLTNTEPSLTQGMSQTSEGQTSNQEPVFIGNMQLRADTIYLNPKPQPGGPELKREPKYLKETTRVKWLSTGLGSSSSKEPLSSSSSSSSSSRPEATSSTSSSSSSGSSTLTNTNTSYRTKSDESGSTTSSDTSGSSSSEEESSSWEGTSQSTKITARKDERAIEENISLSFGNQQVSASSAEIKTESIENNMAAEPGFFQKLAGLFRRKPKSPEELQTEPQTDPLTANESITGAGGLPRPYSDKFLINRLETWHRNRGLEVKVNDGMMEVADRKNKRLNQAQCQGRDETRADGPSVSSKTRTSTTTEESSWVSLDVSDRAHHKSYDTSKPSYTWTTSGEDLSDVPSTLITDTIKFY